LQTGALCTGVAHVRQTLLERILKTGALAKPFAQFFVASLVLKESQLPQDDGKAGKFLTIKGFERQGGSP
jgi:hypothetical protein